MAFWANERSITFKGRFHYKEELQNGNEEESCEESRQKEKAVTDSVEAAKPRRFCFTTGLRGLFAEAFCHAFDISRYWGAPSS
jgi:hypothetical protein